MDIISIYESMLKFSGLEADKQGFISTNTAGKKEPILINGLRLILPTYDNLRGFNPKEHALFHPLAENLIRDESIVLNKYRDIINIRLNYTIGVVVQSLLNIVASPELHKNLNPEQLNLLTYVKEGDDKAVSNFIQQMIAYIKQSPSSSFINIFLKRGGFKEGKKYSRLAAVAFPFFDDIKDLKVRQKDKETFKQVFKYVFPEIENKEYYYYGSSSDIAPFVDALMHSAALLASQLNDVLELFKDYIEDADELIFESEWLEYFDNLPKLSKEISKIPTHVIDDYVQPIQQEPVVQPQPVYQPQPAYQPQQQLYVNPVLQQPAAVQKTDKGLDFNSMLNNNPQLAMMPNPLANAGGYQPPYGYQPQGYPQPPMMQQGYPQQPQMPPQGYPQPPMMQPQGYYPQQPQMAPQGYYQGYQQPQMAPLPRAGF